MYWTHTEYCRWCGKAIEPRKDGRKWYYCCNAHKMAFHRAYKAYVTRKTVRLPGPAGRCVTRKKKVLA